MDLNSNSLSQRQHLLRLCESLADKGITPTVALVRAKSTEKTTLQQAIAILQAYKAGERAVALTDEATQTDLPTSEPDELTTLAALALRIAELEKSNAELELRVAELERQNQ
jgi:hypothetical protein